MTTGDLPVCTIDGVQYVDGADARERLCLVPTRDWPAAHVRPKDSGQPLERTSDDAARNWALALSNRRIANHTWWDNDSRCGRRSYAAFNDASMSLVNAEAWEVFFRLEDVRAAMTMREPEPIFDFTDGPFVDAERAARRLVDLGVAPARFPRLYMRRSEESEAPQVLPNTDQAQLASELAKGQFGGWIYAHPLRHMQTVSVELYFRKDAYDALAATVASDARSGAHGPSQGATAKRRSGITIAQIRAALPKKVCAGKSRHEIRAAILDVVDNLIKTNDRLARPTAETIGRWTTDRDPKRPRKRTATRL